jgi:tRNA (guanine-N7-)-methyltransferase
VGDDEFGVPFPGRRVPHERRTKTGYRDDGRPFDWARVFGREAPRVVDLGCGNGRYLIGSALARPTHDHLGIDTVQRCIDYAAHRGNERGLPNVRFVTADAVAWLYEKLDVLDEIHVYHPQPYYAEAEKGRRMMTPEFLERCWTVLRPDGLLVAQTDNKPYWDYLRKAVAKWFDVRLHPKPWEDAPQGRTRREIQARKKGLAVFRMEAVRRASPLDVEVPRPEFSADRPAFRPKA